MAIKIGTIVVDITTSTSSLASGMSKAQKITLDSSRNIERSLKLITGAAAAMGAAMAGAFSAMATEAEEYAHSIHLAAMATGTSTEMFSKLAYNAKLAGVPIDNVKMALERMARTASAAQGGNKQSVQAYAALGISVKDLRGPLKDSGDLLVAVSKKMNTFKDSTQKTGIEQKLLGRSGAELAPMMHQLATGFDAASKQATLFGVVVGDKTAAQALQLHQALAQLESVALGFSLRLLSGVVPALIKVGDKLVDMATSADGMHSIEGIASSLATVITTLGNAFEFLWNHATAVRRILEGLVALELFTTFSKISDGAKLTGGALDAIGTSAIRAIGKMTGFGALGNIFAPLYSTILNASKIMLGFAVSEDVALASASALDAALAPIIATITALCSPVVIAIAAFAALVGGLYAFRNATISLGGEAFKLKDTWNAAWLAIKDACAATWGFVVKESRAVGSFLLKLWAPIKNAASAVFSAISSAWHTMVDSVMQSPFVKWVEDQVSSLFSLAASLASAIGKPIMKYMDLAKAKREAQEADGKKTESTHTEVAPPKTEAPQFDQPVKPEKLDIVAKKIIDLTNAANASKKALDDVGQGPDAERADEIFKEYTKTIADLNLELKKTHKHVSDVGIALIKAQTALQINSDSQKKYMQELKNSTDELNAQLDAQNRLNDAIGQGAEAVRDAAIAAYVAKRDDAKKSPDWIGKSQKERDDDTAAFTTEFDSKNDGVSKASIVNVNNQIAAQLRLNAVVLQGKDAQEAATLANEQKAIKNSYDARGDKNTSSLAYELELNAQLFEQKKKMSDLQRAESMSPARAYAEQAKSLADAASAARDMGDAVGEMQLKAADKANWDAYLKSVDDAKLAVGDAGDGVRVFFDQMARESKTAAESMKDALSSVFDSLNHQMTQLMTGQKANFAEMFRGFSTQMAQFAIKKGEQSLANGVMNKLGKGDQTKDGVKAAVERSNAYLQQIASNTAHGLNTGDSGASADDTMASAIGTGSSGGGALGTVVSMASMIPGLGLLGDFGGFGGHFATGGNVTAGMSYDVGELGREKFTPTQDGKITPHNQMSNGGSPIHIDARGANDPAQTEMAIHRAMSVYAPVIAAGAMGAAKERNLRSPSSRRG